MGTHGENSREYKFEMMRLHHEEGISIKVLSEQFGVAQATLFGWRAQYRKYGEDAFVGCGQQRPGDAEMRKLRKENEELKMQVEILKKAAAYQAREKSKRK